MRWNYPGFARENKRHIRETISNYHKEYDAISFENDHSEPSFSERKGSSPSLSSNVLLQIEKKECLNVNVPREKIDRKIKFILITLQRNSNKFYFYFLDAPYHEHVGKSTEKSDQDEIHYLIHQTFFSMK